MEDLIMLPLLVLVFGYITITLIFKPHLKPKKEPKKTKTEATETSEATETKEQQKPERPQTKESRVKKFIIIALAVATGIILAYILVLLFNFFLIGSILKAFS